jgi:hypothetical protein
MADIRAVPDTADAVFARLYEAAKERVRAARAAGTPTLAQRMGVPDIPAVTATLEIMRWRCIASDREDPDGTVHVNEEDIGRRMWEVSIPVADEDHAILLAAALGGEYGAYASHRYPRCPWVVTVKREEP